MAYTPINWATGDTITAEKLNKMDNGWSVESLQLFSETVTTTGDGVYEGQFTYTDDLTADTIIVTYDGTEYTCPSIGAGEYGAPYIDGNPDFSVYPFNLFKDGDTVYLTTQTAGEHTVAAVVSVLQTTPDFDTARGYGYVTGSPTELFSETVTTASLGGRYSASLAYANAIDADTITVAFDGINYTCPRIDAFGGYYYGGFSGPGSDFTNYPFVIESLNGANTIYTETASTHTIAVTATVTSMRTSSNFSAAVEKCLPILKVELGKTTFQEVSDAIYEGLFVYGWDDDNGRMFYALSTIEDTANSEYGLYALTKQPTTLAPTTAEFVASSPDSPLYAN